MNNFFPKQKKKSSKKEKKANDSAFRGENARLARTLLFLLKQFLSIVPLAPALYFQEATAGAEDSYIWVSFSHFFDENGNLKN